MKPKTILRYIISTVVIVSLLLSFLPVGALAAAAPSSGTSPQAMPPHPDLLEKLEAEGEKLPDFITDPELKASRGIDQPGPLKQPSGSFNAIALLVQFTDNASSVGASFFDTLIFGAPPSLSVRDYYDEVSYGTLDIVTVNLPSTITVGIETGWFTAPQLYSYYTAGAYGFGSYPNNAQKLVEDAVLLADAWVDFSVYDNDLDGYVDALMVVHAGPGAELTNNPNDIWSHKWATSYDVPVDGVFAHPYAMMPEYWITPYDMTIGVYAHEMGHVFGLPDLYDRDYSSEGIGNWSLMAGGSWNGPGGLGGSPAHLDAWSRSQLAFATPTVVTTNTFGASIPDVETSGTIYRLWTNGAIGNEYFLVENRQPIGYDSFLPGYGLLIWHVDEAMTDNDDEVADPENWNYPLHYLVALEQADGLFQLELNVNRGDSGDPYPGSTVNRFFSAATVPNSGSYDPLIANNTGVGVNNISDSALTMTADLLVTGVYGPTYYEITRGTQVAGTLADLQADDGNYKQIASEMLWYWQMTDWYGETTISEDPSLVTQLTITYDGHYIMASPSPPPPGLPGMPSASATQNLYVYNFATSAWEQIDSRTVDDVDITISWSTSTPQDYISTLNGGDILLRVQGRALWTPFTCFADLIRFTVVVTPPPPPPPEPPPAPTDFAGTALSTTAISWSWTDNATDETEYRVHDEAHTDLSGALAPDTEVWVEDGLDPNTQYTRHAYVENPYGSAESDPGSCYTLAAVPTNLASPAQTTTTIDLTWDDGNPTYPATSYGILRDGTDWIAVFADNLTATSYTDTGLTPDTTYTYEVCAYNGDGVASALSSPITVTTEPTFAGIYYPTSITIMRGDQVGGTLASLNADDGDYKVFNSGWLWYYQAVDWYGTVNITEDPASVTQIDITYDGKYSLTITQKLYLYNFATSAWELIDTSAVGTSDVTINWSTTDVSYISGTGEMRLRVSARLLWTPFTGYGDLMRFTITSIAPPSPGPPNLTWAPMYLYGTDDNIIITDIPEAASFDWNDGWPWVWANTYEGDIQTFTVTFDNLDTADHELYFDYDSGDIASGDITVDPNPVTVPGGGSATVTFTFDLTDTGSYPANPYEDWYDYYYAEYDIDYDGSYATYIEFYDTIVDPADPRVPPLPNVGLYNYDYAYYYYYYYYWDIYTLKLWVEPYVYTYYGWAYYYFYLEDIYEWDDFWDDNEPYDFYDELNDQWEWYDWDYSELDILPDRSVDVVFHAWLTGGLSDVSWDRSWNVTNDKWWVKVTDTFTNTSLTDSVSFSYSTEVDNYADEGTAIRVPGVYDNWTGTNAIYPFYIAASDMTEPIIYESDYFGYYSETVPGALGAIVFSELPEYNSGGVEPLAAPGTAIYFEDYDEHYFYYRIDLAPGESKTITVWYFFTGSCPNAEALLYEAVEELTGFYPAGALTPQEPGKGGVKEERQPRRPGEERLPPPEEERLPPRLRQ